MKDFFQDPYSYTDKEYSEIWDNSIFVVDTNVLLNLYRYTDETRHHLLQILSELQDNLWMPHHVGLEYQNNRVHVIIEQSDAFDLVIQIINNSSRFALNELKTKFNSSRRKHSSIKLDKIKDCITQSFSDIVKEVTHQKKEHPDLLKEDSIRKVITQLFNSKIGNPYNQEALDRIYTEGEERYKNGIPPGYKDSKKEKLKYYERSTIKVEYSDLIVWKQILDKAKNDNVSVVFITDDTKEDWWQVVRGRIIGPRQELINEFKFETNQDFLMYNTEQFMTHASQFLRSNLSSEAIKEVKKLTEDEKGLDSHISTNINKMAKSLKELKNSFYFENPTRDEQIHNNLERKVSELFDTENLEKLINEELLNTVHTELTSNFDPGMAREFKELQTTVQVSICLYYGKNFDLSYLDKLAKKIIEKLIENKKITRFSSQQVSLYFVR